MDMPLTHTCIHMHTTCNIHIRIRHIHIRMAGMDLHTVQHQGVHVLLEPFRLFKAATT